MHSTVGVILENINDLSDVMEKYSEALEVDPYIEKSKEELIYEVKEYQKSIFKAQEEGTIDKMYIPNPSIMFLSTDEEFYLFSLMWNGCDVSAIDEEGNHISTFNQDSQFDYYSVGGRAGAPLLVKKGTDFISQEETWMSSSRKVKKVRNHEWASGGIIKNINFKLMREKISQDPDYQKELALYEQIVEGKVSDEMIEEIPDYITKESLQERYKNKEEILNEYSIICYNLVVDGNWISTDEKSIHKILSADENQDKWFVVLDYHF